MHRALRGGGHPHVRRRPVRARAGAAPDPAARRGLLRRRAERRGSVGVQRGTAAAGAPEEPVAGAGGSGFLMNLFDELPEVGERRFGEELGATLWGGTVYELAPGKRVCPYHWHFGEEEWLLVVSGTPTLRTPSGERMLGPWEGAAFVGGAEGAHEVRNDSGETGRGAMVSTGSAADG